MSINKLTETFKEHAIDLTLPSSVYNLSRIQHVEENLSRIEESLKSAHLTKEAADQLCEDLKRTLAFGMKEISCEHGAQYARDVVKYLVDALKPAYAEEDNAQFEYAYSALAAVQMNIEKDIKHVQYDVWFEGVMFETHGIF